MNQDWGILMSEQPQTFKHGGYPTQTVFILFNVIFYL